MKNKIVVQHQELYEVDVIVRRTHPKVRLTEPDKIRVTKLVRRTINKTRGIELIGTPSEQSHQLRRINNVGGQVVIVSIMPGRDAILSTTKPAEIYKEVKRRQRPIMKIIPTKVTRDEYLPTGTWKELGPEPPPRPTIEDLVAKFNSRRNK